MNNTKDYPSNGMYGPINSFYGRGAISSIGNSLILEMDDFAIVTLN